MTAIGRILLAEDNANDVELVLNALEQNHLANEVIVARDGAEALDYLFRRGAYANRIEGLPVVVLLDLKMPKVDGLEVLRQIKSDPTLKRVPIVMMTSSREEQDLLRSYELGVNSYLVKPVRFQQFVEAVKSLSVYWVLLNEPPPGALAKPLPVGGL
ncbi:MAG: response regulator [Verrucomicrobiales bacterium]|nr:response regulator [Verrucomicrobiales bacterium]